MNAICERCVLSAGTECINEMILMGEESLRRGLREYCNLNWLVKESGGERS